MPLPQDLEQDRHDLRLKLLGCQAQWESQVGELERDVRALNAHTEQLTRRLSETERDKSRSEEQHIEIRQQLQEQLQAVSDVSFVRLKINYHYNLYHDNAISATSSTHVAYYYHSAL